MKRNLTVCLTLFLILAAGGINTELTAQTDLSEGWEVKEAKRQPPDQIMDSIGIRPGMVIGEVGAGRGRFTVYLARRAGASGQVLANDISKSSLKYLDERCTKQGFSNVKSITGEETDPLFPDHSLDAAIMVYVYHHLNRPDELLKHLRPDLKPGAILAIVEMRDPELDKELRIDRTKPDPLYPPIAERIAASASATGFRVIKTMTFVDEDYIFVLEAKD